RAARELFAERGEAEPVQPQAGEQGRHRGAGCVLAGAVELVEAEGGRQPAGGSEGSWGGELPGGAQQRGEASDRDVARAVEGCVGLCGPGGGEIARRGEDRRGDGALGGDEGAALGVGVAGGERR